MSVSSASGIQCQVEVTYTEKHPALCENHLRYGIWLFRQRAVFTFQQLKLARRVIAVFEPVECAADG